MIIKRSVSSFWNSKSFNAKFFSGFLGFCDFCKILNSRLLLMKAILTNVSHVAKDCLLWADSPENC